jgi:hypothetical protein
MSDNKETLAIMQQMRQELVEERRAVVHAGATPGKEAHFHIDKLIALITKIETIDRAIADEKKRSPSGFTVRNL